MQINSDFVYELFSNVYYTREFPTYQDIECSTTEAVQCLLKSFLFRKVKRVLLNPKIVILSFGSLVHEALRLPLEQRGFKTEVESKIELGKYTLYSHTDAYHPEVGLELKTISKLPHEILDHHFLQTNTYHFMNNETPYNVAYIHKPSGIVKVFPLIPNVTSYDYVKMRAVRLCHCLTTNTMPKPEPSWLCQYCEYTDICPTPLKTPKGGF